VTKKNEKVWAVNFMKLPFSVVYSPLFKFQAVVTYLLKWNLLQYKKVQKESLSLSESSFLRALLILKKKTLYNKRHPKNRI